jgi:hypothetical protein
LDSWYLKPRTNLLRKYPRISKISKYIYRKKSLQD